MLTNKQKEEIRKWLLSQDGWNYVGNFEESDDFADICLDGNFDLEELANSLLTSQRESLEKLKFILEDINSYEEDGEVDTLCKQGLEIINLITQSK